MKLMLSRGGYVVLLMAMSAALAAQDTDESGLDALDNNASGAQQGREPPGAVELRSAMRRIAQYANDADALADAGNASLTLGDANAALNFFTRANALRPNNGRIVSGLATATVRTENPFEALRLFDDAVRLGISERSIAVDRALAFDLLGNFARAQQDYKLARTASTSDDLIIRQAISLSLAGDKSAADGLLLPLLKKNNAAAWRARAFMLAARGDFRESTKVTQGFMDANSAQRMERFLRLMPELTGAQQAAAIHLGHFPASHNVGRDSEQVRRVASTIPPVEVSRSESRLIPAGDPLGPKATKSKAVKEEKKRSRRDRNAKSDQAVKVASANIPDAIKLPKTDNSRMVTSTARAKIEEAQVAKATTISRSSQLPAPESARPLVNIAIPQRAPVKMSSTGTLPAANSNALPTTSPVSTQAQVVQSQPVAPPRSIMTPVSMAGNAPLTTPVSTGSLTGSMQAASPNGQNITGTSNSLLRPAEASPVKAAATAKTYDAPASAKTPFDLAAVVGSIKIPDSEYKPSAVPVDLKKLKPVAAKLTAPELVKAGKADPKVAVKIAVPTYPARFWVQIATGEGSALGYDFRKWAKKSPELFKGRDGWTSAWGKTSRLLVGPFADLKASKKWEADFRKAGGNGYGWKSENGTVVTALKVK